MKLTSDSSCEEFFYAYMYAVENQDEEVLMVVWNAYSMMSTEKREAINLSLTMVEFDPNEQGMEYYTFLRMKNYYNYCSASNIDANDMDFNPIFIDMNELMNVDNLKEIGFTEEEIIAYASGIATDRDIEFIVELSNIKKGDEAGYSNLFSKDPDGLSSYASYSLGIYSTEIVDFYAATYNCSGENSKTTGEYSAFMSLNNSILNADGNTRIVDGFVCGKNIDVAANETYKDVYIEFFEFGLMQYKEDMMQIAFLSPTSHNIRDYRDIEMMAGVIAAENDMLQDLKRSMGDNYITLGDFNVSNILYAIDSSVSNSNMSASSRNVTFEFDYFYGYNNQTYHEEVNLFVGAKMAQYDDATLRNIIDDLDYKRDHTFEIACGEASKVILEAVFPPSSLAFELSEDNRNVSAGIGIIMEMDKLKEAPLLANYAIDSIDDLLITMGPINDSAYESQMDNEVRNSLIEHYGDVTYYRVEGNESSFIHNVINGDKEVNECLFTNTYSVDNAIALSKMAEEGAGLLYNKSEEFRSVALENLDVMLANRRITQEEYYEIHSILFGGCNIADYTENPQDYARYTNLIETININMNDINYYNSFGGN